jgi:hypothetical protein
MEDLTNYQRGQIVGARLTGVPLTKTATLSGVSKAADAKVNSLNANSRLLYLKAQSVPRCKHFSTRL